MRRDDNFGFSVFCCPNISMLTELKYAVFHSTPEPILFFLQLETSAVVVASKLEALDEY